jgi:hypothetical protein
VVKVAEEEVEVEKEEVMGVALEVGAEAVAMVEVEAVDVAEA